MATYQKCECGAFFEPTICPVCQEERWIEEIESLKALRDRYCHALLEWKRMLSDPAYEGPEMMAEFDKIVAQAFIGA